MGLPKKKVSRSRGGMRRAHQALRPPCLSICPQCKQPKLPHVACRNCGYYGGRKVLETKEAGKKS